MNTTLLRSDKRAFQFAMGLAIVSLGLLFSTTLYGQESTASGGMTHAFGVKGGANWSTLYVKEARDVNQRFGGSFGLFGRTAPTGGLGIQIEALYDQKGTTVTKIFDQIDQKNTYKFDYIDVPLVIIIPLGEVAELQAGGYLGAMVLSERKFEGDLLNGTTDPGDGQFNPIDYGLVGGFALNLGMAQIGARYNHGLNAIAKDAVARAVLGDSKNACAQIYLALALGKGE